MIVFLEGIGVGLIIAIIIFRPMSLKKKISNLEDDNNRLKRRINELEWIISDLKNDRRKERKIGDPGKPTGWEKNPDGVFTTISKMLEAGM